METSQPPLLSTDPPPPTAVDPSSGDLAATLTSSEPLPSPSAPTPAAPSPPPPSLILPPLSNSSIASPSPSQPQDLLQQSQQRQPVACRTRSHTQPGQSPLTPSTSSSSSSSSSSSAPSVQRSGMAIGVPAIHSHHTRPSLPSGYSYGSSPSFSHTFTSSSSFSQTLGSFPRSLASMAEQSTGSSSASPSFSQSFSGMPRSSAMMEQQQPNSNAPFKPPVPGVQTIGMIGSLSGPSRIRASGIQHQQRLVQTIDRSMSQPATNQTLNSQFSSPMLSRPASMSSPNAPLSAPQTAQSLQQQWMSNQGKQTPGTSFPPPYRPHMKQNISQQNPQTPQQQQHSPPETTNQVQVSSSGQHQQHEQQHQQQNKLLQLQQQQHHHQQQQNKYIPNNLQELHTFRNQQSLPQQPQQAVRAHGSINQRPNNPLGQPVVIHSGSNLPITADTTEMCTQIVTKRSIQELVAQIDPFEKLDPEVEDVLVEIADDFVESITTAACSLAKHRRSNVLEAKDILLHVERNWNMTLPGFGGDEIKCYKKPFISDIHKERLAMVPRMDHQQYLIRKDIMLCNLVVMSSCYSAGLTSINHLELFNAYFDMKLLINVSMFCCSREP